MVVSSSTFHGLPVETKSGTTLGIIYFFEIDLEIQTVLRYSVGPDRTFFRRVEYIIARNQVVSIDKHRMVVEDGCVAQRVNEPVRAYQQLRVSEAPPSIESRANA